MTRFDSPAYKRSRAAYVAQCTFHYFITLLVSDAFLAKLLSHLGISDALTGIISSFVSIAFVIQFFSLFLVRVKASRKTIVMVFETISSFCFMLLYLVPLLPVADEIRTLLVIASVMAAYAGFYLVSSILFKWGNSYVDPGHRGQYSATKEMISLITGIAFTTAAGYIIDRYEGLGNLTGGFLFIAVSIFILNVCNFVSLALIKRDKPEERKESSQPMGAVLRATAGNKNFRSVIFMTILWDVARYTTIGFMGIYKTNDLMLSVLTVQIINMAANFLRMAISKPFGRYSDRNTYAKGFRMALYLAAGAFFINIFTTPSTWIFVAIFTVLYNCSFAGTNMNSFNIAYSYVDEQYVTQAMAIKNCIGGLFGFGASILAGKILAAVQANSNMILGIPIHGQQLLSAISFAVTVVLIIYIKQVIEKQHVMRQ